MSLQTAVRSVSRVLVLAVALAGVVATFTTVSAHAQEALGRKVKSRISPAYPEIARKMALTGVVKLEVTVAPNGSVKDTKVIGGNPILVNAAIDAVKKWRYEPGNDESVGVVEFKFEPTTTN